MGLENVGISPLTPTAGADFNNLTGFTVPTELPAPAAKKGDSTFTVADMPASFLATPETAKPAAATETPAAATTTTESGEPIKIEFGNGSFSGFYQQRITIRLVQHHAQMRPHFFWHHA